MTTLVIVESPGKIKKIQSILGSKYVVAASVGHIIDLAPDSMSVDLVTFEPSYQPIARQVDTIKNLKQLVKKSTDVLLATDEDREGEMIAWSLAQTLELRNPKRIVFNSITETALNAAVAAPGVIDEHMVDAQKGRRILDRLLGYELSPLLWKAVQPGLSAGRVQSVVVRLIVEREDEINAFFAGKEQSSYKFIGQFDQIKATLHQTTEHTTKAFKGGVAKLPDPTTFTKLAVKSKFILTHVFTKESIRNPSAPFTTSTLQQEAAHKLGFTVKRTMQVAQKLYENGHITYMRTDSTALSTEAIAEITQYVRKTYGAEFHQLRTYEAKKQNTQEAHEAVRPTHIDVDALNDDDEGRLYKLIWRRTVASQMASAKFDTTTAQIALTKSDDYFFATQVEKMKFAGFLAVYGREEQDVDIVLPEVGSELNVKEIIGTQEYERPPSRYNEASLIEQLDPKNLNIGRPATYATIIDKIQEREYVKKVDIPGVSKDSVVLTWTPPAKDFISTTTKVTIGAETAKFQPSYIGRLVTKYLMENFPNVMDYQFTAKAEESLDKIARNEIKLFDVLSEFYNQFHPIVVKLLKAKTVREEVARSLGKDPNTGYEVSATLAKYGPVVKLMIDKKPRYAKIPDTMSIDTITLEQALQLLSWPKTLGMHNNSPVLLNKGKFGMYLSHDGKTAPTDDEEISLEQAIELLNTTTASVLATFSSATRKVTVRTGQYGKYLKIEPKKGTGYNVKLPEEVKIEDLNDEKIDELIAQYFEAKKTRFKKVARTKKIVKKKVAKKVTKKSR